MNAGHNAPILLRGDEVLRLEACGPVVGLIKDVSYESAQIQLLPEDVLIGYTDGISEAMTAADEEWGEERLIEAARQIRDQDASEIGQRLLEAADVFTAGAEQHDDMTITVLRALA